MSVKAPGIGARVTWSSLPGKPTSFPPAAHTHAWGDITDKPTTFAPSAHTHSWADVTGKPATYPPATHTHAGLLTFIGNLNVAETLLVGLSVGMKRKSFALAGVQPGDLLFFAPTAAPTVGCEVVNVYPASTGTVSVGYYTPALSIAAAYSMPIAVYRIV